jgi:hypothetical protein
MCRVVELSVGLGQHITGPHIASLAASPCKPMSYCLPGCVVGTADGLTKPADDALLEVRQRQQQQRRRQQQQQPAASRERHQWQQWLKPLVSTEPRPSYSTPRPLCAQLARATWLIRLCATALTK